MRTLVTFDGLGVTEKDAPLLYFSFEEERDQGFFSDRSGNGLRASCDAINNECPATEQAGQVGRAADFDGINDELLLAGQTINSGPEITLAAWVQPDTIPSSGYQRFITLGNEKAVLRIENQQLDFYMNIGGGLQHVLVPNVLQTGIYQHIAGTYDGETMRVYYNGLEVGSRKLSGTVDNSGTVRINQSNEAFDGRMDEVAILGVALNASQIAELMTGRYNTNDLVVQPGGELNYSVTVTNSHPSLNAAGQLVATSEYLQPAIPEPEMVLNFEPEDYVVTVPNSSGEGSQVNCIGDGSCPASAAGKYGIGLAFDGQDSLRLPPLLYDESAATLAFWLKVNSLPAANERMYIIDTVRSEDGTPVNGDVDIWLDSNGYLWFDVAGDVPQTFSTSCSTQGNGIGDSCDNTNSSWAQPQRSDYIFTPSANYVHVLWSTAGNARLYIDGDFDSWYRPASSPNMHIGQGTFGNSADNTSGLDGAVDELVAYRQVMTRDETNVDRIIHIRDGKYYIVNVSGVSDSVPVVLYELESYIQTAPVNTSFLNLVGDPINCLDVATCPTIAIDGGATGDAADFDGVDDTLPLNQQATADSFEISLNLNLDTLPASGQRAYLFSTGSGGIDPISFWIESDGLVYSGNYLSNYPIINFDFSPIAGTDTWVSL
ncbi:MAG: laminin G domain-containing protein, partial [Anaerolineales bacterium]|nr:laminin G domain-containing protein [Anaerolineales bacterium]